MTPHNDGTIAVELLEQYTAAKAFLTAAKTTQDQVVMAQATIQTLERQIASIAGAMGCTVLGGSYKAAYDPATRAVRIEPWIKPQAGTEMDALRYPSTGVRA